MERKRDKAFDRVWTADSLAKQMPKTSVDKSFSKTLGASTLRAEMPTEPVREQAPDPNVAQAARSAGLTHLHVGDIVFYCGSWAGDSKVPKAVQYYGRSARVLQVFKDEELKLQFSDGKIYCTKNWSRREPTLPGKFRRHQWVYYVGNGCFKHAGDSCLFGHRFEILGRAASNGDEIALKLESGDGYFARHTSLSTQEPRHCSGFFLHQKVYYVGSAIAKHHSPPTSYYGQAAVITSFTPHAKYVWLRLDDDYPVKTSSFVVSVPRVCGDRFCIGDEVYYAGSNEVLFGRRATIKAVLPDTSDGLLVQFRDGTTKATTEAKLSLERPREQPAQARRRSLLTVFSDTNFRLFAPPARNVHFRHDISMHVFTVDNERDRLPVQEIFYSQDSIKNKFQDGRSLGQMERELRVGVKHLSDIPRITVVRHEGRWFSVDNRRLWVFKRVFGQQQSVPVCRGAQDHRFWSKFTTKNRGVDVRVR
ncbi:unnamed protein product [Symbiodinium sp. CCMP2592]|nr:unnamed protein product [Symbiodinium sp. CCMP2592]